ncbi:hypothetical protein P8452_11290 [Trifolium repens]|nr:hypothetical protein P8452_11290 [Trifolium repens]
MAKALSTLVSLCIETSWLYTKDYRVYKANQLKPPSDDIPIFHNLTHLKLHNNWDLVVQVLHHCPKLQNLQLYQGLYEAMPLQHVNFHSWKPYRLYLSLRKRPSLSWWLLERRKTGF